MDLALATQIQRNIETLIAAMDPPVIPVSTLVKPIVGSDNTQSLPADTTVTIAPLYDERGRSRFVLGAKLGIYDGSGERLPSIEAVDTDTDGNLVLSFDFAGMPAARQCLQISRPAGTKVYTNLLPYAPIKIDPGVVRNDPFIYVAVTEWNDNRNGAGVGSTPYLVQVGIERRYKRMDGTGVDIDNPMDVDVWAGDQQDAIQLDMERIGGMLVKKQKLSTAFSAPVALQFAPLGEDTNLVRFRLRPEPRGDFLHLVGTLTIVVNGTLQPQR